MQMQLSDEFADIFETDVFDGDNPLQQRRQKKKVVPTQAESAPSTDWVACTCLESSAFRKRALMC
jgi:hypothetical protein